MNATPTAPPTHPVPAPPAGEQLDDQRAAITELGDELRVLVDAVVRTETSPDVLRRITDEVRLLTAQLSGRRRVRAEIPAVDEFPGGVRMFSPVTGPGSPLAPPMRVTPGDGGMIGRCTLGIAHEGPPGYGHGGMSAMLLDEVMGWACAGAGLPGMTVSLQVRYRRPVPLETPLRVRARVTGTEGRKVFVEGAISTGEDSMVTEDDTAVTAEAVFVTPNADRTRALFPDLRSE